MKIFKEVFARIWALWGLVSFVVTFLIIFIPCMMTYLIKDEVKSQDAFIAISRWWMRVWLILIGCPFKVRGLENFAKGKQYVVTFNHNTFLDVPLSCPFVPSANKTIAKKEFTKIPVFGQFYKKGSVLVDRNSDASRRKSFEDMKTVLSKKMHMLIYPEGTRNRTSAPLKPFFDGAFKLAVDTHTDVLPCLLFNAGKAMPINKTFYLMPTRLEMHFLPPVSSEGLSTKELKDKVFGIMTDYYVTNAKLI